MSTSETNKELQTMREKEEAYKKRFSARANPVTEEEKAYLERLKNSTPVKTPNSIDDLIRNMQTLAYGRKKERKQLISFEDGKKLFEVASLQLTDGRYTINEYNQDIIDGMIKWFIADSSSQYDLKRGLCFIGYIGTGKTKIFEIFRYMMDSFYNEDLKFKIKTCTEISKGTKGADDLKKYYGGMVMFDDIGTEENDVKIFGNTVGVMSDIIFQREQSHELNGLLTHFTTNLMPSKLEAKYGDRIFDRINKMCNIIITEQNFSWRRIK